MSTAESAFSIYTKSINMVSIQFLPPLAEASTSPLSSCSVCKLPSPSSSVPALSHLGKLEKSGDDTYLLGLWVLDSLCFLASRTYRRRVQNSPGLWFFTLFRQIRKRRQHRCGLRVSLLSCRPDLWVSFVHFARHFWVLSLKLLKLILQLQLFLLLDPVLIKLLNWDGVAYVFLICIETTPFLTNDFRHLGQLYVWNEESAGKRLTWHFLHDCGPAQVAV